MKKKFVMMLLSAMMVTGSMSIAHAAELDKDFADMTIETEGVYRRSGRCARPQTGGRRPGEGLAGG